MFLASVLWCFLPVFLNVSLMCLSSVLGFFCLMLFDVSSRVLWCFCPVFFNVSSSVLRYFLPCSLMFLSSVIWFFFDVSVHIIVLISSLRWFLVSDVNISSLIFLSNALTSGESGSLTFQVFPVDTVSDFGQVSGNWCMFLVLLYCSPQLSLMISVFLWGGSCLQGAPAVAQGVEHVAH